MRKASLLAVLVSLTALGCGNEVTVLNSDGPSGTGGGAGAAGGIGAGATDGGSPTTSPTAIQSLRAPDEYSVEIVFDGDPDAAALANPQTFQLTSATGEMLDVLSAQFDASSNAATLTTARQKLGITYTLTLFANGELGEQSGTFPSADTARLWASDFDDPNFADYEVVAERRAIGDRCVVYVQQGLDPVGVDELVESFDEEIFPIETEVLHEAPDRDGNERILLLGLDGGQHYGGYFSPLNAMTDAETVANWGYHSNEMEMLYINVAYGDVGTEVVVPHEFSHLLYNEQHGLFSDWSYHNEGLAECAVNLVRGEHAWALPHFMADPSGNIGGGLSLVDWQYGNYDQYTLAYVFWSYLASRLGGIDAYGDIFDQDGSPASMASFIQSELGVDFATLQHDALIATWVRAPEGIRGFEDVLSFPPGKPPAAPLGASSVDLPPYAGTYLQMPGVTSVDYPGGQGPSILYAGINGAGIVDLQAPFDIDNGALVVLNTNPNVGAIPEPSGPFGSGGIEPQAQPAPQAIAAPALSDRAWMHPPPLDRRNMAAIKAWRSATRLDIRQAP